MKPLRLLVAVAIAAAAFGAWKYLGKKGPDAQTQGTGKGAGRAVAVGAATARRGDLNVYLSAPGSVVAFNTVTVRSRVDGEIVNVAFTEGQLVKEGDLLFEIDPRPYQVQLEQALGQLEKDKANLKNAQVNLDRFKEAKDAISEQQIDTMAATVTTFEGTLKSDEAAVDAAKLQLVYSKITAPTTGRIGLRLVDRGNVIRASESTALAVITQIQPIAAFFSLPQDDIAQIATRVDSHAKLVVEVHDRELRTKLATGELLTFDNQVDPATGTIRMKAVFKNEERRLFPNQFVNARLLVDTLAGVVLVPSASVQRSPRSTFVYIAKVDEKGDGTVELREVTTGPSEGDETVIEKGVAPGELVITEGVDKLQSGSKVSVPGHGGKNKHGEKKGAP